VYIHTIGHPVNRIFLRRAVGITAANAAVRFGINFGIPVPAPVAVAPAPVFAPPAHAGSDSRVRTGLSGAWLCLGRRKLGMVRQPLGLDTRPLGSSSPLAS
jgi:hypothetical protein